MACLPFNFGPEKVPPIIGMTMRSCPVGTGPSEKRSPNSAFMLYSSVIFGATGASWAIVVGAVAVSAAKKVESFMIMAEELCVRLWEASLACGWD